MQKEVYRSVADSAVTPNRGFDAAAIEGAKLKGQLRVAGAIGKGAQYGGGALMVVGAAMDGYRFGTELNRSIESGDYSNTVNEGARIAGGWSGAALVAPAFAKAGAAIGTIGGPVGTTVGGVVGGLIGGVIGYYGGSKAATATVSYIKSWFH